MYRPFGLLAACLPNILCASSSEMASTIARTTMRRARRPSAVLYKLRNFMGLYYRSKDPTKSTFACSDATMSVDTTVLKGEKMLGASKATFESHYKQAYVANVKPIMMTCPFHVFPKGLGLQPAHASSLTWSYNSQRTFMHMESNPKDNEGGNQRLAPVETSVGIDPSADSDSETFKVKRKKLKGKRAVVRWLKQFRWKKKKEYERMTSEEKVLYKLKKAQNKEARLVEALKKLDPQECTETTHDPEILTPEEHFYFLKMGLNSRNYVPVGRRGIYQGVILNMHLHWKKHQTLKVIVKTFTPVEVREIAAELARLSGGIVLDIHEEDTIIMYRGKNYVQPPTEIMSPRITLSRRKALDKSKYRDALRAVRKFIPKLEQDLQDLHDQAKCNGASKSSIMSEDYPPERSTTQEVAKHARLAELLMLDEKTRKNEDLSQDELSTESDYRSESEALSDMFETASEGEEEDKPLYLDVIDKLPSRDDTEVENFEDHLRKIASASGDYDSAKKFEQLQLDEVDKVFLRAGSLLKRTRP